MYRSHHGPERPRRKYRSVEYCSVGFACVSASVQGTGQGRAERGQQNHWAKDYNLEPITWQHQPIPVRPPIMTYLGHALAHPTQEDTAWDMVTTQLHHDIAAYRTLPLNAYEKVAIINTVFIPRWAYRGVFLGNRSRMALWDDIVLHYVRDTPGIEQQMNKQ